MRLTAVVLAGGESRRFGTDKLAADLQGLTLLERAVSELPTDADLIIVGPKTEDRTSGDFRSRGAAGNQARGWSDRRLAGGPITRQRSDRRAAR
jgi:molybdopterin-guanine dinucleotide biosynthesis protein A